MLLKKMMLAIAVLTLGACSGGGGGDKKISIGTDSGAPAINSVSQDMRDDVIQAKFPKQSIFDRLYGFDFTEVAIVQNGQRVDMSQYRKEKVDEIYGTVLQKFMEDKPVGLLQLKTEIYHPRDKQNYHFVANDMIYNQVYSVVIGSTLEEYKIRGRTHGDLNQFEIIDMRVYNRILPSSGKATFRGKAFDKHTIENPAKYGNLEYTIDFDNKTGKGRIDGLTVGNIELKEARLSNNYNIDEGEAIIDVGKSNKSGYYDVKVAGSKEISEIVGKVYQDDTNGVSKDIAGFAGVKEK